MKSRITFSPSFLRDRAGDSPRRDPGDPNNDNKGNKSTSPDGHIARGDLLSPEALEQHASGLASAHRVVAARRGIPVKELLARGERYAQTLERAYVELQEIARKQLPLMPGDEWLLDNYHLVRDTATEVRVDLPRRFYLELPRVSGGTWSGYPRVFMLAWELIAHTDSIVNPLNIEAMVRGYQSVSHLTMGELWALPAMLRLALMESLAGLASEMLDIHYQFDTADRWADRILAEADALAETSDTSPTTSDGGTTDAREPAPDFVTVVAGGQVVGVPPELARDRARLNSTFLARLSQRLRDAMPMVAPVMQWVERQQARLGATLEEAIRAEFSRHATIQLSVSNTITSMRTLVSTDWATFVEQHSSAEAILRTDPAGVYSRMDFQTRDRYRHVVERLARRSGKAEEEVAQRAAEYASEAQKGQQGQSKGQHGTEGNVRFAHVGYYLIDKGVYQLRDAIAYRSRLGDRLSRASRGHRTATYLGAIAAVSILVMAVAALFVVRWETALPVAWAVLALALALLPASEFAVRLVDQVVTVLLPPRALAKIDCSAGVPDEYRSVVAIPMLLRSTQDVTKLAGHLELLYLANRDSNVRFAILSDFADAPHETVPGDQEVLEAARDAVEKLNARYAGEAGNTGISDTSNISDTNGASGDDRFYLFHRKREWNGSEGPGGSGIWMGWERKRGKLADFNALLLGRWGNGPDGPGGPEGQGGPQATEGAEGSWRQDQAAWRQNPFIAQVGNMAALAGTRFVITLDADTELARGAAARLIGTLAHPLNQPSVDPTTGTVTDGYGVLQPRVSTTWESARSSLFTRVFSGHTGIDPYSTAVSNVYQDLFREGIYIGKGIYDLRAFAQSTGERFPENTLLSHDLLEGAYARAGYASDTELYEDYPARVNLFAAREHRWVRGDWQIARWILPSVPSPSGRARNPLSAINRWKIFDNLRRSLVPPATVALLALAWTVLPGRGFFWTLGILLVLGFPVYSHLITAALQKPPAAPWPRYLGAVGHAALTNLEHFALVVAFLAHQSYYLVDAIARTLARVYMTRRNLLEWTTASEAHQALDSTAAAFWKQMSFAPAFSVLLAAAIVVVKPESLAPAAPFLLLWAASPAIAYWVSKPPAVKQYTPSQADRLYLRRVARKSWRYFEDFVGPDDMWLAPDNFQENPKGELAHRTSPTNLGLLLLSTLSAYDFGYLAQPELVRRLANTLSSMEKLERYNGHFYNWYDTRTGQPLQPGFISTVDSGNLAGHLITLKQGCLRLREEPLLPLDAISGLRDAAGILNEELVRLRGVLGGNAGAEGMDQLVSEARALEEILSGKPQGLQEQAALFDHVAESATAIVGQLRQLAHEREVATPAIAAGRPVAGHAHGTGHVEDGQGSSPLVECLAWSQKLASGASSLREVFASLFAWLPSMVAPQHMLADGSHSQVESDWRELVKLPSEDISPRDYLLWCSERLARVRSLQKSVRRARNGSGTTDIVRWLDTLQAGLQTSLGATRALIEDLEDIALRSEGLSQDMRFGSLFDRDKKLFSVGFNAGNLQLDNSYYDFLASEARLASYLAIARGEVPQEHWFRLSRMMTGDGARLTLLSWSGTMFEYLMPNLVMRQYAGTLLAQASAGVVWQQQSYASSRGVPWGISESAFNALDAAQNYQYRAFGVPDLGLKRGLSDDLVVAPYATLLALPVDPPAALANLGRLRDLGMEGPYAFYDSVDFTPQRLSAEERWDVVRTYMVHHVGMSLLAIDNYLNGNRMVERFHSEPAIAAVELLLQERIPVQGPVERPHPVTAEYSRIPQLESAPVVRSYATPDTSIPRAHLLSNGHYSVMVTNSGSGYSRYGDLSITRWRSDMARDEWGTFVYVRDALSGTVWSSAAAPLGGVPAEYEARFTLNNARFHRRDGDIETQLELVVSPEDDAEVRRVTMTNRGEGRHILDLTSYMDLALAPQRADEDAPAFNKLFVETEYLAEWGALLATRRPRTPGEQRVWLVHVLSVDRESQDRDTTGFLGSPVAEQYETDRLAFLGRGRKVSSPYALGAEHLAGKTGAVLDPIMSLRQRVSLRPNSRVTVSFVTALAGSRDEALRLAEKYHEPAWAARALLLSSAHARLELRQLGISTAEALQFQRLYSRMLYPHRTTAPSGEMLARNSKGQSGLWAYGISGDLPVLLVRISESLEMRIVREALRAHEYWRSKGFECDLVILNEYPGGYIQPLQDELERVVSASHARNLLNAPGGVYVKRADIMPEADRILLNSVARVVLLGSQGTLARQLSRIAHVPAESAQPQRRLRRRTALAASMPASTPIPADVPATLSSPLSTQPVEGPPRQHRNGHEEQAGYSSQGGEGQAYLGRFSEDGREYVMEVDREHPTPLPWSNIIANPTFGCIVTESSLGSTWSENSRENRLTTWSNDPVSDTPAEAIYIRDEEDCLYWTPTPLPVCGEGQYTVRHGQGYTLFEHSSQGIEQRLRVFVPPGDPLKVCTLQLKNTGTMPRKLSLTYYAEWVLGVTRDGASRYVVTDYNPDAGAILARNSYNVDFGGRIAFLACTKDVVAYTADRLEFLGRNRSISRPAGLNQSSLPGLSGMSGRTGAGLDPCGAIRCTLDLGPGEQKQVSFVLGQAASRDEALALAARYRNDTEIESEYASTLAMWDGLLSAVQVQTPDEATNLLLNRWLLYQAVSCRYWGRSAFYQGGGAYGFRDQLQDVMALVHAAPEMAREHILRCAEHQFKEGDVQHWWHPPVGRGVRTRFSDDLLWLPFVTSYYVSATGDADILDEKRRFLVGPELQPDQEDLYSLPETSEEEGTLYEHCLRAIQRGTTAGEHGLPLMGAGDWNDGMNRVGIEGKGESVWVGWFLYAVLQGFVPLCEARGDAGQARKLSEEAHRLKQALDAQAWDGEWYLRAFYDDGTPLGSKASEECKIDSIAQSWAVISGAGAPAKARMAMQSVAEWLEDERERLLLLFTPPFDRSAAEPGYIKGYPPGIRENGGQYTHAAVWAVIAHALLGEGDTAFRLFRMLNPLSHSESPDDVSRYMVEPYVIAADIYSHPQHGGRGGWTWYTGSASWYYRAGIEYILGLRRRGDKLFVRPCIPATWSGYTVRYKYGQSLYQIVVENKRVMGPVQHAHGAASAAGATGTAEGARQEVQDMQRAQHIQIELDGKLLPEAAIVLSAEGGEHLVRVQVEWAYHEPDQDKPGGA